MAGENSVHDVTHDLSRALGLTMVFGNPGSAGRDALAEFSGHFTDVLASVSTAEGKAAP